jgi:uncharacterized protein YjbJ (UPF0337 family)
MNLDIIKGDYKRMMGELQMQWGILTDDTDVMLEGCRTKVAGMLQKHDAQMRDRAAAREIESFES